MRSLRIIAWATALSLAVSATSVGAQEITKNLTDEPYKAPLVYDDVVNFIRVQKLLEGKEDTVAILQTEYLDKGTPGLAIFIEKYNLTAEDILKAMRKRPEKYSNLDDYPEAIAGLEGDIHTAYAGLKKYIPSIVYPPTFFLVSDYYGINSGSVEGQLITVEKWTLPVEGEVTMMVHELTHFQQVVAITYEKYKKLFHEEKSLLGLCIREGTAEFFANLVTGTITQDQAYDFTVENEKRLWEWFQKEMHGRETGDWMWSSPADSAQPRHVGYVLGSFIVQSYYDHAEDKSQAVREILGVTDYDEFLSKSRYAEKFEN